jgi:hypothetical protein
MPRLAPVALELAVVAAVLIVGGLAPALWAAQDGTGGLVVAAILILAGGIYFAVVSRLRREAVAKDLDAATPARGAAREPLARTAGRATADGLVAVAIAAATVLIDLGAIGIALVLGIGGFRVWQRAQVRSWERRTGRVLLREPSITRGWLTPEHLRWDDAPALDTGLVVVDAPADERAPSS